MDWCFLGLHKMGANKNYQDVKYPNGTLMREWDQECIICGATRHWKAEIRDEVVKL